MDLLIWLKDYSTFWASDEMGILRNILAGVRCVSPLMLFSFETNAGIIFSRADWSWQRLQKLFNWNCLLIPSSKFNYSKSRAVKESTQLTDEPVKRKFTCEKIYFNSCAHPRRGYRFGHKKWCEATLADRGMMSSDIIINRVLNR